MNPLACTACRPIWQEFRKVVDSDEANCPPDKRRWLITEYLRLCHEDDHDEAAVVAKLRAEHEANEAAREEIRRAVGMFLALRRMSIEAGE